MKCSSFIYSLFVFFLFSNPVNAQNEITVSEALKDLNKAEIIQFDSKTNSEKKLYKKWKSYPQISKVIISESYDTLKLNALINEIAKNENIEEVNISVGKRNNLPGSFTTLSKISILKIYNSTNFNQENSLVPLAGLIKLSGFSWINNNSVLQINLAALFPNLKTVELIDTGLQNVLVAGSNFLKDIDLESLTISVSSINEMVIPENLLNTVSKLNLIDLKKYKSEESQPDFLEIDNDLSVKFFVVGDKTILIEYFGNSSVLPEKEKVAIQKKLGGKEIAEWRETTFSKTPEPDLPASPIAIIENDVSTNFEHKNPSAVPPIKTLVLPKTTYSINTATTTKITRENGTTIEIPQDAFADKNGNNVNGNVTITYKEYLDPLSIFASGIPMTYDSGGVKNTFTSAGMFEIYAFNGSEELQLKSGKNIEVQFASINDGTNYNFYQFDEAKKAWKYESGDLEKAEIDPARQTNNFRNVLRKERQNLFLSNEVIGDYNFDTTCFQGRFDDLRYFNLLDFGKQTGKVSYWSNYYEIDKREKHFLIKYSHNESKNLFKITNVSKPSGDSVKHVLFTFNNNTMLAKFPELRTFYGYVFYAEDFEKYKYFKEHYFKNKIYSDVRVEYNKGDEYCTFVLKTPTGYVDLRANILDVNKKGRSPYVFLHFNRKYKFYKKKLARRENDFNRDIEDRKMRFNRRRNRPSTSSSQFAADTSNFGKVTWSKPINSSRRATLVKTGLYNCDVQYEPVDAVIVDLNLKNESDSSIKFDKIFTFDRDMNGYMTFDTKKVVVQPKTTMGIITSTAAGILYYVTKTGLENKDFNKKEVDINMVESTGEIKTISDLARLFRR
ncbi:MAG: hypothetical protein ACKVQB_00565 [Bacteroidia bacterium]